jgi:hypothetical protein
VLAFTGGHKNVGNQPGDHGQKAGDQNGADGLVDIHRIRGPKNASNGASRQGLDGGAQRHTGLAPKELGRTTDVAEVNGAAL